MMIQQRENTGIIGICSPVDKYMYTYENVHSAITSAKLPLEMLIIQLTTHNPESICMCINNYPI